MSSTKSEAVELSVDHLRHTTDLQISPNGKVVSSNIYSRRLVSSILSESKHYVSIRCNNESHPLYGTFMSEILGAIFEWDAFVVNLLRDAKRAELKLAGKPNPSTETVEKAVTKTELARHYRRKTRGTEVTIRLLDQLRSSFTGITDSIGVPLLKEDAIDIFETEKRHVNCIQDPDEVQLYTKTGELVKGGITLQVYRCSRGTTSLESFNSHIKNFIPGTDFMSFTVCLPNEFQLKLFI